MKSPRVVVLKIYDPRFSSRLRSEEGMTSATRCSIREYLTFVTGGGARQFLLRLHARDKILEGASIDTDGSTVVASASSGRSYPIYLSSVSRRTPESPSLGSGSGASSLARAAGRRDNSPRSQAYFSSLTMDDSLPARDKFSGTWSTDAVVSPWTAAQNETYLWHKSSKRFWAEKEAYHRLRHLQGTRIPVCYGKASLKIEMPALNPFCASEIAAADRYCAHKRRFDEDGWLCGHKGVDGEMLGVKALVLEHVDGFSLSDLGQYAPRGMFAEFIDEAMDTVHRTGVERDMLHPALSSNNFIVSPRREGGYRVVMVDFAESTVKRATEPIDCFGHRKWCQDEVGRLGREMETLLMRVGYDYAFDYLGDPRKNYWRKFAGTGTS